MELPDRIRLFLGKLTKPSCYNLALFLDVLAQKRKLSMRQNHILSTLPATDFEDMNVALDQVEDALRTLSCLYAEMYPTTGGGLADTPPQSPYINYKNGEMVVTNLFYVPVENLLIELAGIGEVPLFLWKNKIPICISKKKGIYRIDRPSSRYEIRGKRLLLVLDIVQDIWPDPKKAIDRANVLRDINDINSIFKEKLNVAAVLIDHSNTSGYFLNEDTYEIIVDQFSTELTID